MAMIKCPFCGSSIPDKVSFCTYCGKEIMRVPPSFSRRQPSYRDDDGYGTDFEEEQEEITDSRSFSDSSSATEQKKNSFRLIDGKPGCVTYGCLSIILLFVFMFIFGSLMSSAGRSSSAPSDTTARTTTAAATRATAASTAQTTTAAQTVQGFDPAYGDGEEIPTDDIPPERSVTEQADGEIVDNTNKVIYDDGKITLTYKGYTAEKLFSGAKIKLLVENNTDKNIYVKNSYINVNGYTFEDSFFSEFFVNVSAGKKNTAEMSISSSQLSKNGIDKLGNMEIVFVCYDDDAGTKMFETEPVSIIFDKSVASGEDKSRYVKITESGGTAVYYKGMEKGSSFSGTKFAFLLENGSSRNVRVFIDNFAVNDFMVSGSISMECMAGKMVNETMSFYSSDLDENEINAFESISFDVTCYDADTYGFFTADKLWEAKGIKLKFNEKNAVDRQTGEPIVRSSFPDRAVTSSYETDVVGSAIDSAVNEAADQYESAIESAADELGSQYESAVDDWIDSLFGF